MPDCCSGSLPSLYLGSRGSIPLFGFCIKSFSYKLYVGPGQRVDNIELRRALFQGMQSR